MSYAKELLDSVMDPEDNRYKHIMGVHRAMVEALRRFDVPNKEDYEAAAILHDIGYSKQLHFTGEHQIDGFLWLEGKVKEDIRLSVLHHSFAEDDIGDRFREVFNNSPQSIFSRRISDMVTYCDMQSDGCGNKVNLDGRQKDILERHNYNPRVVDLLNRVNKKTRDLIARIETDIFVV